jgi:predicted O-methyltransferase YrrM
MAYTMDLTQVLQASLKKLFTKEISMPKICVEIGSFEGKGSTVIYNALCKHPESKLYCIDPLEDVYVKNSDPRLNFWDSACVGQKGRFLKNTEGLINLHLLQGISDVMIPKIEEPIDFAYIDGDHSPAQVYKDAMGIFGKMRNEGIILFDDYKFRCNGVITAEGIDKFLSDTKGSYHLLFKDDQVAIKVFKDIDDLSVFGYKYGADKCPMIFHDYTPHYNRILSPYRTSAKLLLEIGIGNAALMSKIVGGDYKPGASLRMWRDYFPNAQIVGCDILRDVLFTDERIRTFYVDQSSKTSLKSLVENDMKTDVIDIIIDDGSHKTWHQRISFKALWPYVRSGGIYIIEDVLANNIDEISQLATEYEFDDAEIVYIHRGNILGDNFITWKKK